MKKITLLLFLLFGKYLTNAQNTCTTALPISNAGLFVVDAVNGSQIPTPLCSSENGTGATAGEWYAYTPTSNYTVTVTTDLQINNGKDTRFHVYTGNCSLLSCYAGDDDSGIIGSGYLSVSTFNVTAGTTYYIAFDNRWSSSGFTFQLIQGTFVPAPAGPITFTTQSISTINSTYNICVVDMNGDYLDDIVGVSATNIRVHKQNTAGGFTVQDFPTTSANNLPSWSIAAGDYNKDGFNDLMYGGGNGVTFMKSNATGTAYTKDNPGQYIFCQRTNFVDLNNDGNLDAFSCHDVDPNVYYLNNGSGNFTYYQSNVTSGAMSLGIHTEGGNYGSIWIDYDNDGDQDLFIAKCRGGNTTAKINELHRNNGNGTFTDVSTLSNMADPIQTWSSAWADFDNDGDMDALIGASSTTDGNHKYMQNNGDGTFTNSTAGTGWDTNNSTNIEHIAYDFDNNGFVDVMGGGNKIMFNQGNGIFTPTSYSFDVAAVGDLNNDGFLDIQTGNSIRLNNGNTNKWIKLNLQGTQSNKNGIGARVEIYGAFGKQIRDVRSGEGFKHMSTLNVHFGIGQATAITQVIIRWPSGIVDVIQNPAVNQSLVVIEGVTLGLAENNGNNFVLYPNPAKDFISIQLKEMQEIKQATIYDLNGRTVLNPKISDNKLNVQTLNTGTYLLILQDTDGNKYSQKFIKQ